MSQYLQKMNDSVISDLNNQECLLLPPVFKRQITDTFCEDGISWLNMLPNMIENAVAKWQIININTVNNLSFNYVAHGFSRLFNANIILKISPECSAFNYEKAGLLYFNGHGVNKLLDYDDTHNILLLEKIGDGITLKSLFPDKDDEAIKIAANLIKKLHTKTIDDSYIRYSYPTIIYW